jgi:hypothetical protein
MIYLGQKTLQIGAGILIAAVLYACGFFFESRLERRKLAVNTAPVPSQTLTD